MPYKPHLLNMKNILNKKNQNHATEQNINKKRKERTKIFIVHGPLFLRYITYSGAAVIYAVYVSMYVIFSS